VNPQYVSQFNQSGLEFVGQDLHGERMEIFELKGHHYYVGCQYHPEFKSRPGKPSPFFHGLLLAASKQPLP
jgi:CTP synthase